MTNLEWMARKGYSIDCITWDWAGTSKTKGCLELNDIWLTNSTFDIAPREYDGSQPPKNFHKAICRWLDKEHIPGSITSDELEFLKSIKAWFRPCGFKYIYVTKYRTLGGADMISIDTDGEDGYLAQIYAESRFKSLDFDVKYEIGTLIQRTENSND